MQIEEKPPFDTVFEWIGGEAKIKALVERFYDLMDLERGYTQLRAVHGGDLHRAREKLFWFLCGWLGGPQHYTERFGHPMLRAPHALQDRHPGARPVAGLHGPGDGRDRGARGFAYTPAGELLSDCGLDAQHAAVICARRQ